MESFNLRITTILQKCAIIEQFSVEAKLKYGAKLNTIKSFKTLQKICNSVANRCYKVLALIDSLKNNTLNHLLIIELRELSINEMTFVIKIFNQIKNLESHKKDKKICDINFEKENTSRNLFLEFDSFSIIEIESILRKLREICNSEYEHSFVEFIKNNISFSVNDVDISINLMTTFHKTFKKDLSLLRKICQVSSPDEFIITMKEYNFKKLFCKKDAKALRHLHIVAKKPENKEKVIVSGGNVTLQNIDHIVNHRLVLSDNHSGFSLSWALQNLSIIYKIGWHEYVKLILEERGVC